MEGKIHRWLSSVNALPGGLPVRDVMTNHRPEPKEHPGIVVVGDYLFDLDAERPARLLRCRHRHHSDRDDAAAPRPRAAGRAHRPTRSTAAISRIIAASAPTAKSGASSPIPAYLTDLIKIVWNRAKGYKLLVAGSASGELVGALRERGIDAWGIENNQRDPRQDAEGAEEVQQARLHRRHAVQGRRVRFRVRDQPVPSSPKSRCRGRCANSTAWSRPAWCSGR